MINISRYFKGLGVAEPRQTDTDLWRLGWSDLTPAEQARVDRADLLTQYELDHVARFVIWVKRGKAAQGVTEEKSHGPERS